MGQSQRRASGVPSSSSMRSATGRERIAENRWTGTVTRPKLMVPDQIARAAASLPLAALRLEALPLALARLALERRLLLDLAMVVSVQPESGRFAFLLRLAEAALERSLERDLAALGLGSPRGLDPAASRLALDQVEHALAELVLEL